MIASKAMTFIDGNNYPEAKESTFKNNNENNV